MPAGDRADRRRAGSLQPDGAGAESGDDLHRPLRPARPRSWTAWRRCPASSRTSAHFISDFQFNFSQFSTALVSQLVSVPLPSPGGGFTYRVRSARSACSSARRRASARSSRIAPRPSAPAACRWASRSSASRSTRSRASICGRCRRSSRTTTRNCSAAARTWSRPPTRSRPTSTSPRSFVTHGHHRPLRRVAGGADRRRPT